jgi:uncharacterized protein
MLDEEMLESYSPDHVNWRPAGGILPATDYLPPAWEAQLTEVFLAVCYDKADETAFSALRCPNMIQHVAWARRSTRIPDSRARVLFSRALLSEDMSKTTGSLVGIAAVGRADAEALLASEPYAAAGLFSSSTLYSWPRNPDEELNYDLRAFPHAVVAMDKPGVGELRAATRAAHLEYLASLEAVVGAAPLIPAAAAGDAPAKPVGSALFLNAPTVEAAQEAVANDPYNLAGVFESVKVWRIGDIDVDGVSVAKVLHKDPVRDILEKEGLTTADDYPILYEEAPSLM